MMNICEFDGNPLKLNATKVTYAPKKLSKIGENGPEKNDKKERNWALIASCPPPICGAVEWNEGRSLSVFPA